MRHWLAKWTHRLLNGGTPLLLMGSQWLYLWVFPWHRAYLSDPRWGHNYAEAIAFVAAGVSYFNRRLASDVLTLLAALLVIPASLELLQPLLDGQADLVIGSRLAGAAAPGTMPWHQQQSNRIATWCIRRLYGVQLTDLGPFRAIRRQVLLDLDMQDMTYGWPTEMIVKAARSGLRIVEVPVHNYPRTAGQSKISGTVRGTVLATWHILGTIARYAAAQGER